VRTLPGACEVTFLKELRERIDRPVEVGADDERQFNVLR
jgi:hypothetical protein